MASAFFRKNPALIPLFVASGAGIIGSMTFAGYVLSTNPDVIINKTAPHPWNRIQQHENAKLITINKEFFNSRKGVESPTDRY
ncbi:9410_t:CDS:2 [Paraglomus occultum]|uniref:9410_t:CDS:1 n=1 Tax=Paraglomus occultum TaxID=144539 RepID=A0A9N8VL28_9GLOM|nr:9410_t:CDS:2 [Paraglomus occultum]